MNPGTIREVGTVENKTFCAHGIGGVAHAHPIFKHETKNPPYNDGAMKTGWIRNGGRNYYLTPGGVWKDIRLAVIGNNEAGVPIYSSYSTPKYAKAK